MLLVRAAKHLQAHCALPHHSFVVSGRGRFHIMAASNDCLNPGTFWDGETKGKVTRIGGLDAYLSESSQQTGKAIILLPDIFGWEAKNPRLLADKFAASGFTAALPDLFRGEPCPVEELQAKEKPKFEAWRSEHSPVGAGGDAEKVISELRSNYGAKSVGAIGFCWGGSLALHLGTGDKVNAVIMNHGGPTTAEKVQAVKQPFMVNGSDNDNSIPKDLLDEIKRVLDSKTEVPSDVKFFPGSFHGWTCRGDVSDPKMGPLVVDAHERATSWFKEHL